MIRRRGRDPVTTGLAQAVEEAARQALAASTAPGLAVALVHHGQVVWAAGYGMADPATGQPVTANTRFQSASPSKPVTAWGVLRLVESGRIGLDEPVTGRLRRWRPPPSPLDAEGVTVRRLLSHTAGLSVHGYIGQTPDRPLPSIAASLSGETGDSFPVQLLEAPGRRWLYSGGGYSVAQLLVEELTGRPFTDYMQTEVLQPLGMTASSFQWSRASETARPNDADGGLLPDFAFAEQAAAGLVSTALDLARFLVAALAGPHGEPPGRGVLSPAGVRLALTAAPGTEGRWGLGYGLGILPGGDRLAYHEGANRGWRAGLALLPDRRAGIAVLANGDDGSAPDRRRGPAVARAGRAEPEARAGSRRGARRPGSRGRRRIKCGSVGPGKFGRPMSSWGTWGLDPAGHPWASGSQARSAVSHPQAAVDRGRAAHQPRMGAAPGRPSGWRSDR